MSYKIGSFNMHNIGLTALGNDNERDLKAIAEIIKGEQFDVVALQEVLSEGKAFISEDFAKKSILMELGNNWDFQWANAEGTSKDSRHEGYAFVWNKNRLRLASYEKNGIKRIFYPRMCNIDQSELKRKPYYARFTPSGTLEGGPWVEIRLICIHTFYGNDTSADRDIRKNELDILIQNIYPQISDRRYGEYGNGMPSYTILLGDYNVELHRDYKDKMRDAENIKRGLEGKSPIRKPAQLIADSKDIIEITKWGDTRKIKTIQDEFTTLKSAIAGEYEESENRGYSHDYDHFSFDIEQFEGIEMKVRRIDAVRKYCDDDFEKYRKSISDHIPVMMEINIL